MFVNDAVKEILLYNVFLYETGEKLAAFVYFSSINLSEFCHIAVLYEFVCWMITGFVYTLTTVLMLV